MSKRAKISSSTLYTKPSTINHEPKKLVHDKSSFKKGDKVLIGKEPSRSVCGWDLYWVADMDLCIGSVGVVSSSRENGVVVAMIKSNLTFNFPSCALSLVRKKKRVRVGPGPWDAAPCPHLRWHLMGFFRGNLSIVKKEGESSDCTVRCEKCNTSMTLQAKPKTIQAQEETVRTTAESSAPAADSVL